MSEYKCKICGYVYDENKGESRAKLAPGTKWEDIPKDFRCPKCGAPISMFVKL